MLRARQLWSPYLKVGREGSYVVFPFKPIAVPVMQQNKHRTLTPPVSVNTTASCQYFLMSAWQL